MPRACVFCGNDAVPMTKEHIFANWIAGLYGHMPTGISQIVDTNGVVRVWGTRVFQDRIGIVCENCNGGWMSQLEGRVSQILGPIIKSGWTSSLSPVSQSDIAFWAVKTAFVMDHMYREERLIPDSEYRAFYDARQPLPSHMVWIAERSNPADNLASSLKEQVLEIQVPSNNQDLAARISDDIAAGARIYRVTFSVGHLAVQVFGHTLPTTFDVTEGPGNHEFTRRIWPASSQTIIWPPPRPIEDIGGLRGLHEMFGETSLPRIPRPIQQSNRKARRAARRTSNHLDTNQ